MYKHWRMVTAYSASHFIVDFACAFLIFRSIVSTPDWYFCLLFYNFFAFAMQMPIGIIADKLNRNYIFAALGCLFVCAAYGFAGVPILAVVIAGLGNGMFHIGGGIDVLNVSKGKSGALGVFVSPGAFGLFLGTILGKGSFAVIAVIAALIAAAAIIIVVRLTQGKTENAEFSIVKGFSAKASNQALQSASKNQSCFATHSLLYKFLIAVACLFFVVCLRSYVGFALSFPWKGSGYWAVVLVLAVVLGKTAGGFAADKFGAVRASTISLGLAALLFLFPSIPFAGVLSVFMFNMTMPITLWAMAKLFSGAKGFAFGILTFGLFIGFLPTYLELDSLFSSPWMFSASAVISLLLIVVGLRKAERV